MLSVSVRKAIGVIVRKAIGVIASPKGEAILFKIASSPLAPRDDTNFRLLYKK